MLTLGLVLRSSSPEATTEDKFFSQEYRESALRLFDDDKDLVHHAFTRGSEVGRKSFYSDDSLYFDALRNLSNDPQTLSALIGKMTLDEWLSRKASETERKYIASVKTESLDIQAGLQLGTVLKEESKIAIQAVLPLTFMLLLVLTLLLREKLKYKDEFALGILFAVIGMALLTSGIRLGLGPLGGQVGAQLPRAFSKEAKFIDSKMITPFDTTVVFNTINLDGSQKQFFNLVENNEIKTIEFKPERFDKVNNIYEYVITRAPLLGPNLTILGILLVLLFAFGMGFGATMAEPGLNALGITVEELTVGEIGRASCRERV